jgi:hypothetical protein
MQVAISVPQLEREMLQMPQAECQVWHRFGPGVYIREMLIPAGTLILGHSHRNDHINVMLSGTFALVGEDGDVNVLRAPMFFVGSAGRKMGYAIEDTVWQNIYATEERDLDKLEDMFIEKSEVFLEHERVLSLTQNVPDGEDCNVSNCIESEGAIAWLGPQQQ